MYRSISLSLIVLATYGLIACGDGKSDGATTSASPAAEVSPGTLAGSIADAPGLATVAGALNGTGLAGVFDGAAPYTLLAPDDDAFGKLGDVAGTLKAPENGAAMAEILRAHILPGYVTVADIDAALKARQGKPVKMTTMAGGEVTFARVGDELTVTAADGTAAKVDGQPVAASNGVAIPIDTVLRKVPTAGG